MVQVGVNSKGSIETIGEDRLACVSRCGVRREVDLRCDEECRKSNDAAGFHGRFIVSIDAEVW
jgi:hydrogenase maturation factor